MLAREVEARVVLLDERRGRVVAARLGLRPLGTLGLVLLGKRAGRFESARYVLDTMRDEASFWIEPELLQRTLAEAGE